MRFLFLAGSTRWTTAVLASITANITNQNYCAYWSMSTIGAFSLGHSSSLTGARWTVVTLADVLLHH